VSAVASGLLQLRWLRVKWLVRRKNVRFFSAGGYERKGKVKFHSVPYARRLATNWQAWRGLHAEDGLDLKSELTLLARRATATLAFAFRRW